MKKIFRTIRNIITFRPIRKYVARRIKEYKTDKKYKDTPKYDYVVKPKSVLICEPHFCHGECLPGWTKYLQDLGYNVDIITRYSNFVEDPFCDYKNKPRVFGGSLRMLKTWLADKRVSKYEYIFITTTVLWDEGISGTHFIDYLGFTPKCKNGCLFIDHAPNIFFDKYNEQTLVEQKRIFALSNLSYIPQLNPHYFGEFTKTHDIHNNKKVFVAVGRMNARNYDCLLDAIRKLKSEKHDFIIKVIGSGKIEFPDDLQDTIIRLGRLNYKDMYSEILSSDYIIGGLDPFNEGHHQYLVGCTTGSLQLSFGFHKPIIINELFGKHYELDNSAVFYKDNDIYSAMKEAICMSDKTYKNMVASLDKLAKTTYKRSLSNLKTAIESTHKTGKKTNMVLMCKTYLKNLPALKILKESIDKYNVDKIPFYIVAPSEDIKIIRSELLNGNEDYFLDFIQEDKLIDNSLGNGWLDQQVIKLRFYKLKVCDFYLVLDSDSYFIRDFYISDFMYDDHTPYIVCHEGKSGTLLNTKFGNTQAMYNKEEFIRKFFDRRGKHYRFLTSPFMFSSHVCRELDKQYGADWCIKLCSCEAAWHGEMLLSMGLPYKPTELFFECMVYQGKLDLWRKLKISTKDISNQYLGIGMQDKLLKEHRYENI